LKTKSSFRDALSEALISAGSELESMVVLTPDLAKSVRIMDFRNKFPERFINTGISEADMIGVAAGLTTTGLIPVVVGFSMFVAEKPFEQIRNIIAYPNLNIKIIATHSGICVGRDGATHQAIEDMAIMRVLPNFTVLAAADAQETKAAIKAALQHHGPVYLRLGRDEAVPIYDDDKEFIIGKSDRLQEGNDIALIACGIMVNNAMDAAKQLRQEGINARVINAYSIKPLDEAAVIAAAKETGAIVTIEDHLRVGGLGSAVAELLVKSCPIPMETIGVDDMFGESGSSNELFKKYGLTVENIMQSSRKVLQRKIYAKKREC